MKLKLTLMPYSECKVGDTILYYTNRTMFGEIINEGCYNFKELWNGKKWVTGKKRNVYKIESVPAETLVIPQKQVITSEGINIKNYPIHRPLKFENTMLPLWITILVISMIFFGISLAMFLSV